MTPEDYDRLSLCFKDSISSGAAFLFDQTLFENELDRLWNETGIPYETLYSFVRNVYVTHIKRTTERVKRRISKLDVVDDDWVALARKERYPPYLLARLLVEQQTGLSGKHLANALKEPEATLDKSLVDKVQAAVAADPINGPRYDGERHMVGIEFEVVLEHKLRKLGLSFETEAQLRELGTPKTPDILLSVPVAVKSTDGKWKVVNWIDSKALFGDAHTHNSTVLPQLEAYVHRFGPGMVLYWFDHAPVDRLEDCQGDVVIQAWDLPSQYMLPSGEVVPEAKSV